MKRAGMIIAILSVFAVSAFGQGPRALAGLQEAAERPVAERPMVQIQKGIADLYLAKFKDEVGLSDEQFVRVSPLISRFLENRFQHANQKKMLEDRQAQLLSQPNPSEAEMQRLNEALSKLDEGAAADARFMRILQPELAEIQKLRAREFHRKFMTETLPDVLERVRSQVAPRDQQQRPADARQNQQQNRKDPARQPANTLQRKNTQPTTPVRKNPAR